MDIIRAFEVYLQAADRGSFSEAARALGLTPSAVSKQVAALEDHYRVALIMRSTRGLALTTPGQDLLTRARSILAALEDARQSLTATASRLSGHLRVSMPVAFGRMHVAPYLPGFLAAYPDIKVELSASHGFVDLIRSGFDLAIRLGELTDSGLRAARLAPLRRVIAASPAYLARRGTPQAPQDLVKHECLTNPLYTTRGLWHFRRGETSLAVPVTGALRTDDSTALRQAALDGLGIVMLGSWTIGGDLKDGTLLPVLTDWIAMAEPDERPAIHAVYAATHHVPANIRMFIDYLRRCYGSPPYWDAALGSNPG